MLFQVIQIINILDFILLKFIKLGPQLVSAGQGQGLGTPLAGLTQQPPMSNAIPLEEPQPNQPVIDDSVNNEPVPTENSFSEIPAQLDTEQPDIISDTRK